MTRSYYTEDFLHYLTMVMIATLTDDHPYKANSIYLCLHSLTLLHLQVPGHYNDCHLI